MIAKDPGKAHFYLSLVKSCMRIAGCVVLMGTANIFLFAAFFMGAEIIGIAEEL